MRAALVLLLLLATARAMHRGKGVQWVPGGLLFPGDERDVAGVSQLCFPWPPLSPSHITGQESKRGKERRGVMFRCLGHCVGVMLEELGGEEAGLGPGTGGGEAVVSGSSSRPWLGKRRCSDPLQISL